MARAVAASAPLAVEQSVAGNGHAADAPALPPSAVVIGDSVRPAEIVVEMVKTAAAKAALSVKDMALRGLLAGALLGFATSLAQTVVLQGAPPFVGAIIFPVGFVLLVLAGLELATGNFAVLPMGVADRRVSFGKLVRNWFWVYAGNLAGCLLYAAMLYAVTTKFGGDGGPLGKQISTIALAKTHGFAELGFLKGWGTTVTKGILANWMVTVGVVMAFVSKSTIGRVVAMWLPITIFFALGFEHSIVNMYTIPAGMLFGAPISLGDWWLWNQIPVTLGNIVGGAVFTGLALYATYRPARGAV